MNCAVCPHMKRIEQALKPCANCDAGKLHGQINISNHDVDWAMAQRKMSDHTPSSGVTNLDPDNEDVLRKAMASLFSLDPIELMLVQHIMNGGSYASFAAPLERLRKRLVPKEAELQGRKPGFRQLAKTWADSVERKMPAISPVLRARINPNAPMSRPLVGSPRRKAR